MKLIQCTHENETEIAKYPKYVRNFFQYTWDIYMRDKTGQPYESIYKPELVKYAAHISRDDKGIVWIHFNDEAEYIRFILTWS